MAEDEQRGEHVRERPVSIECAHCGRAIAYPGIGRRPRYCSATCRSRAYELRQAAARLDRSDPMPTVVREVVERVVERDRPVPVPAAPRTAADWIPLLEKLERQARDRPLSLVRSAEELADLTDTVRGLYTALTGHTPQPPDTAAVPAPPAPPQPSQDAAQLTRQQRRALERQQRKRR